MLNEKELSELSGVLLTGILTGAGSIALILSNQSQIMIQCDFSIQTEGATDVGHGENPMSSTIIIPELNQLVEQAQLSKEMDLFLFFQNKTVLRIKPERNGLESYVVTTKYEISPVLIS